MKVRGYAAMKANAAMTPWEFERRDLGAHDVSLDIKYSGICHSDIHQVREEWGPAIFPMVPGHEIAGIVSQIGSAVTKFKVGDRIGVGVFVDSCRKCASCLKGLQQYCIEGMTGTYNQLERDGKTPAMGGYSNVMVINEDYAAIVTTKKMDDETQNYSANALNNARWLKRAVEQRNSTTLKISAEIIRQQTDFLEKGLDYLKPLSLRDVAQAVGMHESTVSRVTTGLLISTPRGGMSLKSFFSVNIASRAPSGDASAVIGWSGDMFILKAENEGKFDFAIPESGGTISGDNLMIPSTASAEAKVSAEKLINFYYDPAIAAEVAAYVNYVCPVKGAQAEMEKIAPELASSPFIFPDDAMSKRLNVFRSLTPAEETSWTEAFQKAAGN